MTERVRIEIADGIADVRLERADKHNAIDREMFDAIEAAIAAVAADSSIRVVVLSGSGSSFCAGLDVQSFAAGPEAITELLERGADGLNLVQRVCVGWQRLPVPVIAALHGKTYGGGLQIALGADIRVLAPDTELSVMEIRWGIIPDMGITQTLRNLVSLDVAKELTFTGRTIDAGEAVRVGLGAGIAEDPHAAALELAREICGRSPEAVRAAKRLFNEAWHADPQSGLELEEALQRELLFSPNQIEAVQANFEKRPPVWKDNG
ncbi:MAG: crotonase/enoyl-CoA hydratase family protein [Gammaproteobacteria bacterium]|nr:crotonase/enoyl-CoA hydratase family protein [Gammaproteobacteria bacterium]NNF61594.1 crotonase/enoyl-CoA hydratase family protein [Gammaproteobacteria bacterium]